LVPQPSIRSDDIDAFGNHVTRLEYDLPHDRLEVLAETGVEVRAAPATSPEESDEWEAVGRSLDYAADCFPPKRPVLAAAEALMHKIHREFKYAPGSTTIRTSAIEAFEARRGVCQDFAHIMIGCLRSRGLAARYVSGYLRTLPPPGADAAYVGADASHAWVSVFCPPFGWIDLDPTNDVRVSSDHIIIAWGRDFGDVSPLRGVIVGGGRHRLSVRVSVQAE
jgi:transglutaminase-like putative cysteine protease